MGVVAEVGQAAARAAATFVDTLSKRRGPPSVPTAGIEQATGLVDGTRPRNRRGSNIVPSSRFEDPLNLYAGIGWKDRDFGSAFEKTREIIAQAPMIGVIISTRVNEVVPFGRHCSDRYGMGFRVILRNAKERPTKASSAKAAEIAEILYCTGDPKTAQLRDSLPTYLQKIAQDSLYYAQDCTEIVPGRNGRPAAFYAVDASTIRIAQHARPYQSDNLRKEVRYVQVIHGRIVTTYTQEQLAFGIRNPTTDIRMRGYGVSELEKVIRAASAILNVWEYNVRAFTQGSLVRGIMNIKEPMSYERFEDFRADFYRWARGVDNAHTTTVLNSEMGFDYTDLSQSHRDLEYGEWFNLLLKIICAAYHIAPEQCNFLYGNIGQSSVMGQQENNQHKIIESKERGLRPLMDHMFNTLDERIVQPLDENFKIEWTGLDAMTPTDMANYNQLRVRTLRTVDELRAEEELEPLPDDSGKMLLDPTWLQARNMKMMAEQQAQMQGQQAAQPGQPSPQPAQADEGPEIDSQDEDAKVEEPAKDKAQKSASGPLRDTLRPMRWTLED